MIKLIYSIHKTITKQHHLWCLIRSALPFMVTQITVEKIKIVD